MAEQMKDLPAAIARSLRKGTAFNEGKLDLRGYHTGGGSYVISTTGLWSDDRRPHDLLLILPVDLGKGQVIPLRVSVNPELVRAVCRALDVMG